MIKIGNWYIPNNKHPGVIEKQLLSNEFHCALPIMTAIKHCDKLDNAIDVGAWIGDSTWILAQQFKNVFAFEPFTETYNCCVKNIFARRIKNTIMYNVGLSDKLGVQNFYHSKSGYAGFVSEKDYENKKFKKDTILTATLDYYNFTDIDFLKIDIDSHEAYMLLGSKEFFEKNNPVIMMESKPRIFDRQPDDLPNPEKILSKYGYRRVGRAAKADLIFKREEWHSQQNT